MAHGKETPRQKMIGMMYLVLTALLALNVSTSVLDAFKIIDEGLSKTHKALYRKIEEVYDRFETQKELNPAKVTVWRDRAFQIRERADTLYSHIQELKMQVLKEAEKRNYNKIVGEDGELNRDEVEAVTDYDTPHRIMIGNELNAASKATILKNELEDFRSFLLNYVPVENAQLRESVENSLETKPPKPGKGKRNDPEHSSWEVHKFGHSPLMGFIAIMSSLQINVRNSEAEVINYLYTRIDEGAIKFNELDATVIPNSNYVIRGNKYSANVFIAARDTTQDPKIYVTEGSNPYKEIKDPETGKVVDYVRREDVNYRLLDIKNGKGIYEQVSGSVGYRDWGGIIELVGPTGTIRKPFKQSYQVAEGSVAVSAVKMNVFYLGVDNPVDISVSGVPSDKIDANNSNGVIVRSGNSWIVRPKRPGNSMIRVYASLEDQKREVGFKEFRVKTVPDPYATVASLKGGPIDKNLLIAQSGVFASMPPDFEFDLTFTVTEFTVLAIVQGFVRDARSNSNRFTDQQKNIIANLNRGNPVYIQDIKAIGPDGSVRPLGTINFKIN